MGIRDRARGARPSRSAWEGERPVRTGEKAQLRTEATRAALDRADWQGAAGEGSWFAAGDSVDRGQLPGGWIQYRLALGAFNSGSTPRVRAVHLEYQ